MWTSQDLTPGGAVTVAGGGGRGPEAKSGGSMKASGPAAAAGLVAATAAGLDPATVCAGPAPNPSAASSSPTEEWAYGERYPRAAAAAAAADWCDDCWLLTTDDVRFFCNKKTLNYASQYVETAWITYQREPWYPSVHDRSVHPCCGRGAIPRPRRQPSSGDVIHAAVVPRCDASRSAKRRRSRLNA